MTPSGIQSKAPGLTAILARADDGRAVVHIYNTETGEHLETLTGHEEKVLAHMSQHHPDTPIEEVYRVPQPL